MDVYGLHSAPDLFRIDDLLDFSNDEIFSISNNSDSQPHSHNSAANNYYDTLLPNADEHFTDNLCVPVRIFGKIYVMLKFTTSSQS